MSEMNNTVVALITYNLIENINDSSELSSESDWEMELIKEMKRQIKISRIKCKNYVENIVPLYSDMEFKTHFR